MDAVTLKFILSICGFLIVAMMGILAFFLKEFIDNVKIIKTVLLDLQLIVAKMTIKYETDKTLCDKTHLLVDKRLDHHGQRLDDHDIKITILEERYPK